MTDLTHPARRPAARGLLRALIEEAWRRARRRRAIYGGAGLSIAVAGAIVFAVMQGSAAPRGGSPEPVEGQGAKAPPARGLPALVGPTYVRLKKRDVVLVQGSSVVCRYEDDALKVRADHDLEGGKLVCTLANGNGPLPHSWGIRMNITGAVDIFRFDADGKPTTTRRLRRLLEGAAAPGKTYNLAVGDRYRAGSTRIACRVQRGTSSFGPSPVAHCYYIVKSKATTRELVMSNTFAGVFSVQLTLSGAGTILGVKRLETLSANKQPRVG